MENFSNAQLVGVQIDLLFCSDSESSPAVEQMIIEVGLRPVSTVDPNTATVVDGCPFYGLRWR